MLCPRSNSRFVPEADIDELVSMSFSAGSSGHIECAKKERTSAYRRKP